MKKIVKIDSKLAQMLRLRLWLWILDPLDGTKRFHTGANRSLCNAFELQNYRGKPNQGIVLIPSKNAELWITEGERVWVRKKTKVPLF